MSISLSASHVIYADLTTTPQAYPPVLLERKAVAIRKSMDEEKAPGVPIRISMETTDRQCVDHIFILSHAYLSGSWGTVISKGLTRPFKLLIYEPIVQLLGLYMAYVYGILYCTHLGVSSILCCLTRFSIHHDNTVDIRICIPLPTRNCRSSLSRFRCRSYGRITNQREIYGPGI